MTPGERLVQDAAALIRDHEVCRGCNYTWAEHQPGQEAAECVFVLSAARADAVLFVASLNQRRRSK